MRGVFVAILVLGWVGHWKLWEAIWQFRLEFRFEFVRLVQPSIGHWVVGSKLTLMYFVAVAAVAAVVVVLEIKSCSLRGFSVLPIVVVSRNPANKHFVTMTTSKNSAFDNVQKCLMCCVQCEKSIYLWAYGYRFGR